MTSGSDIVDWYYAEIMIPTLEEFRDEPDNLRRAYLAAITVSHFADYIFEGLPQSRGSKKDVSAYRAWLADKNFEWGLVRDIGDLSKHCRLDRKSAVIKNHASVQVQTQLIVTEKGVPIVTEGGDYITTEGGEVCIRTPDGREHEFRTVLTEALTFLNSILGVALH